MIFLNSEEKRILAPLIWTLLEVRRYSETLGEICSSNLYLLFLFYYFVNLEKVLSAITKIQE